MIAYMVSDRQHICVHKNIISVYGVQDRVGEGVCWSVGQIIVRLEILSICLKFWKAP